MATGHPARVQDRSCGQRSARVAAQRGGRAGHQRSTIETDCLGTEGGTKNGRGLSPNTIRLACSPVNGAFKQAVAKAVVPNNPLAAVPKPRARKKIPQHWSPEQARHFLIMHEGDRLLPVSFRLGSGLRIGELVHLRWHNVDIDKGLVRINEFASVLGYEIKESSGKSNDAIRTIDVDPHLINSLETQRQLQATERQETAGHLATDFVFTKPAGGAYHPQYLSRLLGRISPEIGLPRLTAHGLRHTSATLMLASGVPPKVAAQRLGHADATLFSNLYSHVTPAMQRDAANRIGDALFGG